MCMMLRLRLNDSGLRLNGGLRVNDHVILILLNRGRQRRSRLLLLTLPLNDEVRHRLVVRLLRRGERLSAVVGGGLVNRECELHPLNGARLSVLRCLPVLLLFNGALLDQFGRRVALEVGRGQLLDTPVTMAAISSRWRASRDVTYLPFSLSNLSPMTRESFLNSRLDLALSESTMRD